MSSQLDIFLFTYRLKMTHADLYQTSDWATLAKLEKILKRRSCSEEFLMTYFHFTYELLMKCAALFQKSFRFRATLT